MVKLANDLIPTIIVIVVVVLLASFIVYNSNRCQREIIETVKQAVKDREEAESKQINQTLEVIKAGMTEEQWQRANEALNSLKHNSTP